MNVKETSLPGVVILEPRVFHDSRGFFLETWKQDRYQAYSLPARFVQDNLSYSHRGVLRGLHFQHPQPQGKLVFVLHGEIFDVAVDIRVGSPTFGQSVSITLSSANCHQIYVPEGFAHGFCVTSEYALVMYKCTDFYRPEAEGGVFWNDPDLAITWPTATPIMSEKDRLFLPLKSLSSQRLPQYTGKR